MKHIIYIIIGCLNSLVYGNILGFGKGMQMWIYILSYSILYLLIGGTVKGFTLIHIIRIIKIIRSKMYGSD
jgi:hypothetical protein